MKTSSIRSNLVPAFLAFTAFAALLTAHNTPVVVWTAPSLHRVGMSDPAGQGNRG